MIKIEYEKIIFKLLNLHETGNNANNNNQCHYNRYRIDKGFVLTFRKLVAEQYFKHFASVQRFHRKQIECTDSQIQNKHPLEQFS